MISRVSSFIVKSKLLAGFTLAVATALAANAQGAPTKVAVISIQGAIASTKDGQKALAELDSKAAPKRKELDQKQTDINALKDQLSKGRNTLSEATKAELYKNIQQVRNHGSRRNANDPNEVTANSNPHFRLHEIGV